MLYRYRWVSCAKGHRNFVSFPKEVPEATTCASFGCGNGARIEPLHDIARHVQSWESCFKPYHDREAGQTFRTFKERADYIDRTRAEMAVKGYGYHEVG